VTIDFRRFGEMADIDQVSFEFCAQDIAEAGSNYVSLTGLVPSITAFLRCLNTPTSGSGERQCW